MSEGLSERRRTRTAWPLQGHRRPGEAKTQAREGQGEGCGMRRILRRRQVKISYSRCIAFQGFGGCVVSSKWKDLDKQGRSADVEI